MSERMKLPAPKPVEDRLSKPVVREAATAKGLERRDERVRQTFFRRVRDSAFSRHSAVVMVFAAYGLGLCVNGSDRVSGKASGVSEKRRAEDEGRRERMEAYLGEDLLEEQVDIEAASRPSRQGERPVALEGFDEALGISHETFERLLQEGYPQGFAREDMVNRISYSYARIPMPERYGMSGYEQGHCTVSRGAGASEIILTADGLPRQVLTSALVQVQGGLGRLLSHELAHASDWQNAAALGPEERLELLDRVVARVESPDAIPYTYVQNIQNPRGDLHTQRLDRAKEYFAELMADAFTVRANYFSVLPTDTAIAAGLAERHGGSIDRYLEDARLVIDHVRRLDPRFQWRRGAVARERALDGLAQERAEALVVQACRGLSLQDLGEGLVEVFSREADASSEPTDFRHEFQRMQLESGGETGRLFYDWDQLVQCVLRGRLDGHLAQRNDHTVVLSLVKSINNQLENLRHDQPVIDRFREEALGSLALLEP